MDRLYVNSIHIPTDVFTLMAPIPTSLKDSSSECRRTRKRYAESGKPLERSLSLGWGGAVAPPRVV
jgi:hypothetical protein